MPSRTLLLTETYGLDRTAEPISVTVSFYREELPDVSALKLLDDQGKPVAFQITDAFDVPSTGPRTKPSGHCRIHFLADVPAHGRRRYVLETMDHGPRTTDHGPRTTDHGPRTTDHKTPTGSSRSEAESDPHQPAGTTHHSPTDLLVTGEGLNVRVENARLAVTLDPTSGQIYTITNKAAEVTLGSPHMVTWNPDYFDPNRGQTQLYDWNPPPKVLFEHGPIFFELSRIGTLRQFPEITLHLTLRVFAQAPYLWVRTVIEIDEDVPLACLRNDEFVFRSGQFTHLAWQESDGRVESRALSEAQPVGDRGELLRLSAETPWAGWANVEGGHAVASLFLRSASFNQLGHPLGLSDRALYLVRAESIHGLYWTRPFIYGPREARDRLLIATAGSFYEEESALCLSTAKGPGDPRRLYTPFNETLARLRYPLRVEIETNDKIGD